MKPGMTISCGGHAVALFFGFMAISAQPMDAPPVQALPVSFISETDFSKLTPSVKNAPQPNLADVKPPLGEVAPEVVNKEEITSAVAKRAFESKPEPKVKPKSEIKADKPPAILAEKPDKPKAAGYRPDQIANLLKKDAAKDPPKRDDKPAQPTRSEPQHQVATAQTGSDPATLEEVVGMQEAQLSLTEMEALRARISNCWKPPPEIDPSSTVYVVLHVLFKTDGSLLQAPVLVEDSASPFGPALAESAKRALLWCQPFTMLKPEHYDQWKDLDLKFVPAELIVEQNNQ